VSNPQMSDRDDRAEPATRRHPNADRQINGGAVLSIVPTNANPWRARPVSRRIMVEGQ